MIMGIDPGVNGAICMINPKTMFFDYLNLKEVEKPKQTFFSIRELIKRYCEPSEVLCLIEKVGGRSGSNVASTDKLVRSMAHCEISLDLLGVDWHFVHPITWKSYLGLTMRGASYNEKKQATLEMVQRQFPKVSKKAADAVAIALLGVKAVSGDLDIKDKHSNIFYAE